MIEKVIKRDGNVVEFNAEKITYAIRKAILSARNYPTEADGTTIRVELDKADPDPVDSASKVISAFSEIHNLSAKYSEAVVDSLRGISAETVHIEDIQDRVELILNRAEEFDVVRKFILYREKRAEERAARVMQQMVTDVSGKLVPLNTERLKLQIAEACEGLVGIDRTGLEAEVVKDLYDGIAEREINTAQILAARTKIETDPAYSYVAARFLLDKLREEVMVITGYEQLIARTSRGDMKMIYALTFPAHIQLGIKADQLHPDLSLFDVQKLAEAIVPERDMQFTYLGLQTLYDRYFLHIDGQRYEMPQAFFMRVAMGLSLHESNPTEKAIEFYNLLSTFDYMTSTPTLFNAGTIRPQLSSCFLTTVPDDLLSIYDAIKDNAMLSKFAGGLGNDFTPVRALGSHIKGTNGKSQGIVPFLKVVNDTAVAVNQCFSPDTLIHTADGVKTIEDVVPGDLVLGISGNYREVTEKFFYAQKEPMMSISVKHSIDPIEVTTGHPFYAICGVPMEQSIERTMEQIKSGVHKPDWIDARMLSKGSYIAQTVPVEVMDAPEVTDEDMRLYGILLGDGHATSDGYEFGVTGVWDSGYMNFVNKYLTDRGIHFWKNGSENSHGQIRWSSSATPMFTHADLYDSEGSKHIARKFNHLPVAKTLSLVQGLLETDGNVSRGKEITFSNTSRKLIEGLRYQLLRLKVPTSGNRRERTFDHTGVRNNGEEIVFDCTSVCYDLRIPAVPEIAELVGVQAVTKRNWFVYQGNVYSRVVDVAEIETKPFVFDLKVEGDESYMTTGGLAHNGGKRKGAVCAYLETFHLDIEEFLELRKNTGDDRRRTHDMNTANWIPDLFMERVELDGDWTLFSPNEVPDLHDLYGEKFRERYEYYEALTQEGTKIKQFKRIKAKDLWRKMLTMLFETGHPWQTFKDPCNLRSPQQHVGVVHSSNLCTEITLNTSADEIAVCNLGSINLANHIKDGKLDASKLERTVKTAVRMLDNVIDINYYSVPQARNSNMKHRPVGLGVMGFQDALYLMRKPYASQEAVEFADWSMEMISYFAIDASCDLAEERGSYKSFEGSLWSQGILPIDSIELLEKARGKEFLDMDRSSLMDWGYLRERVKKGMRNSNLMAIAPTATISNIIGVQQSIEPSYQNLYVKSNLSGEFTVINPYLVEDLKSIGLWDAEMIRELKLFEGSVQKIERIPQELKDLYATAFEIAPGWLIESASRRQKWVDQAQSLNLYVAQASGRKLDQVFRLAWKKGLKTTYYLRALAATSTEKSTITTGALNAVSANIPVQAPAPAPVPKACSIDDPECEACQ